MHLLNHQWMAAQFVSALSSMLTKPIPQSSIASSDDKRADTLIFPTLQLGMLGLTQEQDVVSDIVQHTHHVQNDSNKAASTANGVSVPHLDIATGYMNLPLNLIASICTTRGMIRILSGHPEANGWWGAKGIARYVPDIYSAVAYDFICHVRESHNTERVALHEWRRQAWSYHAKGLWYQTAYQKYPCMTMIGSSNFGLRSLYRDSECALVMLTSVESSLAKELLSERDRLFGESMSIEQGDFEREDSNRRVHWLIRYVARFAKEYL